MPQRVAFPPLEGIALAAEGYLRALGLEVVAVPPSSRRTLDLGIAHSPEMLCAPCKLLFGNYLEAAERGADSIIMLGGPGTCRLGYSAALHASLLSQLGYECRIHTLDLYRMQRDLFRLTREFAEGRPFIELVEPIRLVLGLMHLVDGIESRSLAKRPLALVPAAVERARSQALERVRAVRDTHQLQAEESEILALLDAVGCDPTRPTLTLGLVGDAYTILTPFLNLNLERELGRLGVAVRRWFRLDVRLAPPLPRPLRHDRGMRAREAGKKYLGRDVGGFARATVGEAALMAQDEVDGLIHVTPFNCTPEIVAQSALVALQRDHGMPVLNLSFDEQTGRAGLITRIEAFVEMLWAQRRAGRR
jgi:predicted nucleotide-binding protein (sugar kinase/HSP70/actin superfamily)